MNLNSWTYSLLDSIYVGVCIIDRNYNVLFWNEFMESYTDISRNDIIDQPISQFFPAFENEIYRERIDTVFMGWPPILLSSRLHAPFFTAKNHEGSYRFQELTISPIQTSDVENYDAVLTIADVSDLTKKLEEQNTLYQKAQGEIKVRKQIQKKLKKSEKSLQELVLTKDKFFSIIAHDLKSPFNAMLGISDLLVESCERKEYNNVEKFGKMISESTENTFALLVNLLDWARLQLGKFQFTPESFFIEGTVDNIIYQMMSTADNKEISITKTISPSLKIIADRNMLSTIIRNLLSNAIKFSNRKGTINITASTKKKELPFRYPDTGVGIRKDDIAKLFRVDSNFTSMGTAQENGTGLGLILCKEFIDQHKGKIWVVSEVGVGTTFHFSIPTP